MGFWLKHQPRERDLINSRPDAFAEKLAHCHCAIVSRRIFGASLHPLFVSSKVTGCEWRDGFKFTDFVRTRSYDSNDIKPFSLPGVLRYFDVDEL